MSASNNRKPPCLLQTKQLPHGYYKLNYNIPLIMKTNEREIFYFLLLIKDIILLFLLVFFFFGRKELRLNVRNFLYKI